MPFNDLKIKGIAGSAGKLELAFDDIAGFVNENQRGLGLLPSETQAEFDRLGLGQSLRLGLGLGLFAFLNNRPSFERPVWGDAINNAVFHYCKIQACAGLIPSAKS